MMTIEKLVSLKKGYVLNKKRMFISFNASTRMVRVKNIKTGEINVHPISFGLKNYI